MSEVNGDLAGECIWVNPDGYYVGHILPPGKGDDHRLHPDCWCRPIQTTRFGDEAWWHIDKEKPE